MKTPSIKVGVIAEQTGALSFMGGANANVAKMVIDDINASGGLLGHRIDLMLEDGATTDSVAEAKATKLIQQDKVDVIFGGIYSSTRQAIKEPAVVKGRTLYIYPEQYEGQECDPLIFCTGPVPAQQLDPLIPWLMQKTGAKKFYLPSADYIWPHVMNKKVRELVTANGGTIVGEEYYPLDRMEYGETVKKIMSLGAEVVFNTIVPPGVVPFFQQLYDAGFQKRGGQLICTYFDENLLSLLPAAHSEGLYGCLDYYQDVSDPFSKTLLDALQRSVSRPGAIHRRQRMFGPLPGHETVGVRREGSGIAPPARCHRGARSRQDRRRAGRPGGNGARSAPRAHEHVHRAGEERQIRDREEPWRHRSERGDCPDRRRTRRDGRCGLMIPRSPTMYANGRMTDPAAPPMKGEEAMANGSAIKSLIRARRLWCYRCARRQSVQCRRDGMPLSEKGQTEPSDPGGAMSEHRSRSEAV